MSALDSNGRTIWIADAHRGDGKRFVVRADEKLTAFLEIKSTIVMKASRNLFVRFGEVKLQSDAFGQLTFWKSLRDAAFLVMSESVR